MGPWTDLQPVWPQAAPSGCNAPAKTEMTKKHRARLMLCLPKLPVPTSHPRGARRPGPPEVPTEILDHLQQDLLGQLGVVEVGGQVVDPPGARVGGLVRLRPEHLAFLAALLQLEGQL